MAFPLIFGAFRFFESRFFSVFFIPLSFLPLEIKAVSRFKN